MRATREPQASARAWYPHLPVPLNLRLRLYTCTRISFLVRVVPASACVQASILSVHADEAGEDPYCAPACSNRAVSRPVACAVSSHDLRDE